MCLCLEYNTKVFDGLPSILLSSQQKCITTLRSSESQLIQSNDFTTRLLNSLTSSLGNSQSSNTQLRNLQHSHIIRDRSNDHNRLILVLLGAGDLTADETEGDGRTVNSRLKEAFEDGFVELGVRSAGEETVELYEEEEIYIF